MSPTSFVLGGLPPNAAIADTTSSAGLDLLAGSLEPGTFAIVAGSTSVGRTSFLLDAALAAARRPWKSEAASVLFFSLEEDAASMGERINRRGTSSDDLLSPFELFCSVRSTSEIEDWIHGCAVRPGLVAIDGLEHLCLPSATPSWFQVEQVASELDRIAVSIKVPIIASVRTSRQLQREPEGALDISSASVVALLEDDDAFRLRVTKNRQGSLTETGLAFDATTMSFRASEA